MSASLTITVEWSRHDKFLTKPQEQESVRTHCLISPQRMGLPTRRDTDPTAEAQALQDGGIFSKLTVFPLHCRTPLCKISRPQWPSARDSSLHTRPPSFRPRRDRRPSPEP